MSAKCKTCGKGVYPMDPQINLDGSLFHKPCAKCADCQCQITLSNFTKNESGDATVLLCKTHYFKRFHEGGAYVGGDKFQNKTGGGATGDAISPKVSAVSSIKNSTKCKICNTSVYPMDPQVNLDGALFHTKCAKCADCKCQINLSNFTKNESGDDTLLLCKTHYFQRFNVAGGSFLGGEKYQVKNARDVNAAAVSAAANDPVKSSSGKIEITEADKQSDRGVFDFKAKDTNRRQSIKLDAGAASASNSTTNTPQKESVASQKESVASTASVVETASTTPVKVEEKTVVVETPAPAADTTVVTNSTVADESSAIVESAIVESAIVESATVESSTVESATVESATVESVFESVPSSMPPPVPTDGPVDNNDGSDEASIEVSADNSNDSNNSNSVNNDNSGGNAAESESI